MDVIRGRVWSRPVPQGEGDYGPFLEGCAEGRLLVQRCTACEHRQFYPRPFCVRCAGPVEWIEASGLGSLYTFTVVRQFRGEPFGSELPYVVGMVDLDEGVRMLGTLTDVAVDDVRIGMPVESYAVEYEPGRAIVFWRPRR
jgi:uncharacterized protein